MTERSKSSEELARENDALRTSLEEVTEVLTAIRTGGVDALVIASPNGEQVFTRKAPNIRTGPLSRR